VAEAAMMTSSPELGTRGSDRDRDRAEADFARFALWPLPELQRGTAAVTGPNEMILPPAPSEGELAYERGLEEGRRAAMELANQNMRRAAGQLIAAAHALEASRDAFLADLEDSLRILALGIARQVIQREVTTDTGIVRDLVQRALEALPLGSQVEVHLNPEDLSVLHGQVGLPDASRTAEIQWIPDAAIERGGCSVETPHRIVDGRIDLALQDLYQRMRDV
jgi:flagellar biosynthesis/type III secretory pathway protein FliH